MKMDRNTSQEQPQTEKPSHYQRQQVPIAIVGVACFFPKAKNLQEYWNNIVGQVDCITDVPPSRWDIKDYYDPDPKAPDKTYCKRGGFLPDIEFNPMEFGLPPSILEATDIAQLLSLMVAKAAMEDAGYGESRNFSRERTGVVLGVVGGCMQLIVPLTTRLQYPVWEKVLSSSGLSEEDTQKIIEKMKLAYVGWEENSFPGWLANVVAGRIANRLDLGGMNCVVDAACASSLTSIKMAMSELIEGRSDMMIAGGVEADASAFNYMCFSKTPASSKKDFLNPFDATSDGMMIGEGIGMLVLKRLEDAERDGDRIYAVIKGIGTGSDGRYKSIYAPRPEGQVRTLRRAYEDANISPASIGLIEAHGTGTPAGDLCEITALKEVFGENNPNKQHIALGSVKSQIGHTKAAAGAASLIKAALALHHKILPPTLNVTQPNPKFQLEESPFYLNTETRPWFQTEPGTPRRAAVSSFGFGGTNYHMVLEEHTSEHQDAYRLHSVPQSILLWAESPEQLLEKCETVHSQLKSDARDRYYTELLNSCKSVAPVAAARVGFVAKSQDEAGELLQIAIHQLKKQLHTASWEHPRGVYYRKTGLSLQGKVVALFPGQGSQYLNMGLKLATNFPVLRQVYNSLDNLFIQDGLQPLTQVVFPNPTFDSDRKASQIQTLQQTENAQPAIGALSAGLYKILKQAGFQPDFVAGHSFGELTALWAAEVLSDADYYYLIKARGQAMSSPHNGADCDAGTMLAVNGDVNSILDIIKPLSHLSIANYNSPNQVVLSGAKPEIAVVQQILTKRGFSVTPLSVSAAFHSRFVNHASKPFSKAIESVTFHSPKIQVHSNTTGEAYASDSETIKTTLEAHLLKSVRFTQEIENLYAAGGYCFVEIGPRQILSNFVKSILGDRPHLAIALNPSREKDSDLQLRQAMMQLRVAGLPLQDLDPYQIEPSSTGVVKSSPLNIVLSGSNYVSEKTKAAFEQALQDGHQIKSPSAQTISPVRTPVAANLNTDIISWQMPEATPLEKNLNAEIISSEISDAECVAITVNKDVMSWELPEATNSDTDAILTKAIATTSQYAFADTPNSTDFETIVPIIETQNMLQPTLTQPSSPTMQGTNNTVETILLHFYNHQSEVLRVHEQYLKSQAESSRSFFQLMQQYNQPRLTSSNNSHWVEFAPEITPTNAPQANLVANEVSKTDAKAHTNSVVTQTIERDNKPQVTNQTLAFTVPVAQPQATPVKTSETILTQPNIEAKSPVEYIPTPAPQTSPSPQVSFNDTLTSQSVESGNDPSINQALLETISGKTGYPTEMLEMEMDLEADLGIDSIKRVEIIGAMQNQFPDLPRLSPDELGEHRTIGKIANYLGKKIAETKKKCLSHA
ncbi:acyltransferase domain-containing protein [Scytonema sp. UIC 10036]|uniref:type I polyketide synthase n=1 Tax=Scytonema sp. UIC 10036 TaxID=2304196 RepID=UPI0012DA3EF4|nr:type I polyketide synthase [Scytonema sp. UIC 10036]MUG99158.1 acyltransferase domain-containing protein [Scytonema sp. UIC 10036]